MEYSTLAPTPVPAPAPAAAPAAGPVGPGLYTEIGKKARGRGRRLIYFPLDLLVRWVPAC
jgi:hypothetical protein